MANRNMKEITSKASAQGSLDGLCGIYATINACNLASGVAGMVAAPFHLKPLSDKYLTGKARDPSELSDAETDLVNACCALALGLKEAIQ